jgi:hypothetical protein
MGRGLSASRSGSARATLKMKRARSSSVQKLKDALSRANTPNVEPHKGSRSPANAAALAQKLSDFHDPTEESEAENERVGRADVMTKYKTVGRIVDEVLQLIKQRTVPGANTATLCAEGDRELLQRLKATFSKAKGADGQKLVRGIAYPTNVSVNHVLCNHSPMSEEEGKVLAPGDVVKIHLGAHLDGYPASAATTVLVPSEEGRAKPVVLGSTADAIEAARVALAALIHKLRPGALNADLTDLVHSVGAGFNTEAIEGVLSTRTKRWMIDAMQAIICRRIVREEPQQDVEDVVIGADQVWTLDVAFTSAPAYRTQTTEEGILLFRRNEAMPLADLRSAAADEILKEIDRSFQCFTFHLRHTSNVPKARLGVSHLRKANLIDGMPALQCKPGFITARFSATVVLSRKKLSVVCGEPPAHIDYEGHTPRSLPEELRDLLNSPLEFHAADASSKAEGGEKGRKRHRAEVPAVAH